MSMSYTAVLPLDSDFEVRAHAAHRLWRAINGRALGSAFHELSPQRRERLILAVRALDGRMDGGTYRGIAEVLFSKKRVPKRAWKTHDLRNRTIRLVQGLALMRGGYRELPAAITSQEIAVDSEGYRKLTPSSSASPIACPLRHRDPRRAANLASAP